MYSWGHNRRSTVRIWSQGVGTVRYRLWSLAGKPHFLHKLQTVLRPEAPLAAVGLKEVLLVILVERETAPIFH